MRATIKPVPLAFVLLAVSGVRAWSQVGSHSEFIGFGSLSDAGLTLLSNKGVHKALKASDDQASKMTSLAQEQLEKRRQVVGVLAGRPAEERERVMLE